MIDENLIIWLLVFVTVKGTVTLALKIQKIIVFA